MIPAATATAKNHFEGKQAISAAFRFRVSGWPAGFERPERPHISCEHWRVPTQAVHSLSLLHKGPPAKPHFGFRVRDVAFQVQPLQIRRHWLPSRLSELRGWRSPILSGIERSVRQFHDSDWRACFQKIRIALLFLRNSHSLELTLHNAPSLLPVLRSTGLPQPPHSPFSPSRVFARPAFEQIHHAL